ncbi:MAG: DUF5666 domain-containing protein [Leptothrix ochracea]|uniref:DUF5666 domain-containing protein n=1 Tax=Leptothrix ochracea TaxID=735331 RepID=UPI0034E1974C
MWGLSESSLPRWTRRRPIWLATALTLAVLMACGGGGVGTNGTGSAPQGLSVGTVTGFGSVIVDGARFDDTVANVLIERQPGKLDRAEVKLGQGVEIGFDVDGAGTHQGVARQIQIEPALIGPVGSVGLKTLTLLGQTVQINTDPAFGPVTVFEPPYLALSSVKPADWVEVHAIAVPAVAGGQPSWVATRIEQRVPMASARLHGAVTGVSGVTPNQHFQLGAVTVQLSAPVQLLTPATPLTNGQVVTIFADPAAFDPVRSVLTAQAVRMRDRLASKSPAAVDDYIGGVVSGSDGLNGLFVLDGVIVHWDGATVISGGTASNLLDGTYVRVQGRFDIDGSFQSHVIQLRNVVTEKAAEVRGTVTNWLPGTRQFTVRDVVIDATSPSIVLENFNLALCGATDLSNGQYVVVDGVGMPSGVRAQNIRCENELAVPGAVIERSGVLSRIDTVAQWLELTLSDGSVLHVTWNEHSFFRETSADELLNGKPMQPISVEGTWSGTGASAVLVASKIKLGL